MKKFLKISAAVIAVIIIIVLLWFANGLLGNPVSKMLAKNAGKNHIAETYSDTDFFIDGVSYSFKSGGYYVHIKSPSSIDSHFYLSVSMLGKIKYDSYEHDVLSGWNTYQRIDAEYRKMVDDVFNSSDFPLVSHIDYGTIKTTEDREADGFNDVNLGIEMSKLKLDKQYNVKTLAKTAGHIVYYAEDDEISFEKAGELLLTLKEVLDKKGIPFCTIDFVLEKPRTENKPYSENQIHIRNFSYEDIYEESLSERIKQAHNELKNYYIEQDAKKKI